MRLSSKSLPSLSGRIGPRAGLAVWLVAVGTGMGLLAGYTNRAGEPAAPPASVSDWPAAASDKYRLLMFAHPHCPCTKASVAELARLMARCVGKVDATVYFYRPDEMPDEWVHGRLWNSAKAIPGVDVTIDRYAEVSTRFGTSVSGEVLLYDSSGRLCFHGGITSGRGHEGDSLGKLAVISIVMGESANVDHAPVFGCVFRPGSKFRKR
jgi:hypothetical protein